jgi:ABC-type transporter Mla subunit MlaD
MMPARLAKIEQELKTLRESTAALRELHETVAKDSRSIENTLESHSAAIGSVRAALSQNEELVEGIVETLQVLHGISADQSDDLAEELPVA